MTSVRYDYYKEQEVKEKGDAILKIAKELKEDENTLLALNKDYRKRTIDRTTWPTVFSSFNVIKEYVGGNAPYILGSHDIVLKRNPFNKTIYGKWVDNNNSKKIEVGFPSFSARAIYKPEFVKVCGNLISTKSNNQSDYSDVLGLIYQYLYFYRSCFDKGNAKEIFLDINFKGKIDDINEFLKVRNLFEQRKISIEEYHKAVNKIRNSLISLETSLQLIDKINDDKINPVEVVREVEQEPFYPKRTESYILQNTTKLEEGNELKKVVRARKNRF